MGEPENKFEFIAVTIKEEHVSDYVDESENSSFQNNIGAENSVGAVDISKDTNADTNATRDQGNVFSDVTCPKDETKKEFTTCLFAGSAKSSTPKDTSSSTNEGTSISDKHKIGEVRVFIKEEPVDEGNLSVDDSEGNYRELPLNVTIEEGLNIGGKQQANSLVGGGEELEYDKLVLREEEAGVTSKLEHPTGKDTNQTEGTSTGVSFRPHLLIHSGVKTYTCQYCNKIFKHSGNLKTHLFTHTGEKPFRCRQCEKSFSTADTLRKHEFRHTGLKPHQCPTCSKCFALPSNLSRHLLTHSTEKAYKCKFCVKAFSSPGNLLKHTRKHTGNNPYKCDRCTESFPRLTDLRQHLMSHGSDPYICEFCKQTFTLVTDLKSHKCEKFYNCKQCNQVFSTREELKVHVNAHKAERTFTCPTCSKSFRQSIDLTRHILVHTGEKPYQCEICAKTFAIGSHLKRHLLTHTGEKPFMCEICSQSFSQSSILKRHLQSHTGIKPYSCEICFKTFTRSFHLKRHHRVKHQQEIPPSTSESLTGTGYVSKSYEITENDKQIECESTSEHNLSEQVI